MKSLQWSGTILFSILISSIFTISCDRNDKKKAAPGKDITPNEVGCGENLANGQSENLTLYRQEFAPYGKTCQELAFEGSITCDQGTKLFLNEGSPKCEETTLKTLTLIADKDRIEIGETLAMRLEGIDQRGSTFAIDPLTAKWNVTGVGATVTDSGLVSGTEATWIEVFANLQGTKVRVQINIEGKNCEGTPHNFKKDFTKFKSKRVPFNESCESIAVSATCNNGVFSFDGDSSDTCEVAKLTHLIADPTTVYLAKGQASAISLYLVDDIGTRLPVPAKESTWDVPVGPVSYENDQLKALDDLKEGVKVKVTSQGFSTEIMVLGLENKPDSIRFVETDILLKQGDEKTLAVRTVDRRGNEPVDSALLNWESSDPSKVSVENGIVKALMADAIVTITAKLDNEVITALIKVEAQLSLATEAIEDPLLTQTNVKLVPAYTASITGPLTNLNPELRSPTDGCTFTIHKNRRLWELDVALDETQANLPANCEVEIVLQTAAGQIINQKITIPVNYRKISMLEVRPRETENGLEVARINYKLSRNYTIQKASFNRFEDRNISPDGCEMSLIPQEGSYSVIVKEGMDLSKICSGYVHLEMLNANTNKIVNFFDLVTNSKYPSFYDYCKSPENEAINATVQMVRTEISPSASCEKLSELLRSKNLYAAANQNTEFVLSLANKGVTALEPLARFVGLKELDLANNKKLADITPVAELKLLRFLNLKLTAVEDFSSLYSHAQLEDLRLPRTANVTCSDAIINPEIKKICK